MQSVNAMFIIHSYTAQQESWRHAWAAVKLKSANKNGFFFFFLFRNLPAVWRKCMELDTNPRNRSVYR